MKNKLLLTIILGMFLISLVSADVNSLGTYKTLDCVEVRQTCASCSYVNVSINHPDSSIAVSNKVMTNEGAGLWTYTFCNTSNLGRYDVTGQGDINGLDTGFSVLWFDITSTGGEGMTFWIILIFVFAFLFLAFSLVVNEELFVYISGVCFLMAGIVIMINGIDTLNDWTTRAIAFVSIGLGMLFSLGAYIYNLYSTTEEEEY